MVFKKAKLFWKNENDREIINSVFYDDSVAGGCNKKRIRNI